MAGKTQTIKLTLQQDERVIEFKTRRFSSTPDLVALEHHFGVPAQALGRPEAREEWALFLVYRVCQREVEEFNGKSFEEFIDSLIEYDLPDLTGSGNGSGEDQDASPPTDQGAPIE